MKKIIYIALAVLSVTLVSCEQDLEKYDTPEAHLNFYNGYPDGNTQKTYQQIDMNYSFVYGGDEITQDTIWLRVCTMGFLSDQNRSLKLKQVKTGDNDAVAGTHYVDFNNADIQKYYYIPANSNHADIPVVLLRDASMKSQNFKLRVEFDANENFTQGYDTLSYRIITMTDQLSKPSAWDKYFLNYYLSNYTTGVHKFLIEQTGYKWDDEFIAAHADMNYLYSYMAPLMKKRLKEVNEERVAKGLGVLMEDDGVTPVEIHSIYDDYYN